MGLMGSYVCIHWMVVWLIPFLLFYGFILPRRSAPKKGDNVMARLHVTCPGPGNPHIISLACHEPLNSSVKLILILLYNLDIHVYSCIYWYTFLWCHTWVYAFTIYHVAFKRLKFRILLIQIHLDADYTLYLGLHLLLNYDIIDISQFRL